LADVNWLRKTNGEKGLKEALRGLVARGGNSAEYWPLRDILRGMDAATDTNVVTDLYEQHAFSPTTVDLKPLFARLGVTKKGNEISYDDEAPEAPVRRIIEGSTRERNEPGVQ
jgi:hypothetical protein